MNFTSQDRLLKYHVDEKWCTSVVLLSVTSGCSHPPHTQPTPTHPLLGPEGYSEVCYTCPIPHHPPQTALRRGVDSLRNTTSHQRAQRSTEEHTTNTGNRWGYAHHITQFMRQRMQSDTGMFLSWIIHKCLQESAQTMNSSGYKARKDHPPRWEKN